MEQTKHPKLRGLSKAVIIVSWAISLLCLIVIFLAVGFPATATDVIKSAFGNVMWLGYILAAVFGIIYIGSSFIAIMLSYLALRSRWAASKYKAEVCILAPVIVYSIVIKTITLCITNVHNPSAESGITWFLGNFLKGIYDAFGGLSLEGLSDTGEIAAIRLIPFYGSSIIAALSFIGVIGSTFAYELYSRIQIRVLYAFSRKLRYNTYVFTALNDETLALAKTVETSDSVVIFAGPALEPFDRHNEMCAEVMGNGFFYWSYYEDKGHSIPKSIGLHKKVNRDCEGIQFENGEKPKDFFVFAFDTDEKKSPEEEKNSDAIFDDITARKTIGDCQDTISKDNLFIRYVLLGKGENDYQSYQIRLDNALPVSSSQKKTHAEFGDFTLWTEAKAIARQASFYLKHFDILDAAIPNPDKTTVRSIGFGETARIVTKELYIHSAMIKPHANEEGKTIWEEAEFYADIFDRNGLEIAGFFHKEMPYSLVYTDTEEGEVKPKQPEPSSLAFKLPYFHFNEKNYTHLAVDEKTQEQQFDYIVIGIGEDRENIRIANSIIYDRLGWDEKKRKDAKKTIVFVVVYDKRNNHFLTIPKDFAKREKQADIAAILRSAGPSWKKEEIESLYDNVRIFKDINLSAIIIGNREDTFRFPLIRNQRINAHYDSIYQKINGEISAILYSNEETSFDREEWQKGIGFIKKSIKGVPSEEEKKNSSAFAKMVDDIYSFSSADSDSQASEPDLDKQWANLNLWDRYSNIELGSYSRTYYELYRRLRSDLSEENVGKFLAENPNEAMRFIELEHTRWDRVHIASGWRTGKRDKERYRHSCLTPFEEFSDGDLDTTAYDFANVVQSIRLYRRREQSGKNPAKPE